MTGNGSQNQKNGLRKALCGRKTNARSGFLRYINSLIRHNSLGDLLVRSGKLSPIEMRHLLKAQNQAATPVSGAGAGKKVARIGQLAVRAGYVRPRHIVYLLLKQKTIRVLTATMALFITMCSFSSSKSRAGSLKDVPALIQVAQTPDYNRFEYITKHPSTFGMKEIKSKDLSAFKKWRAMFERFESQISEPSQKQRLTQFQEALRNFQGLETMTMIRKVNELVNSIDYVEDHKNWDASDYWATPLEFMEKGGDCEDYAIMKYVALRAMGFPENRLRMTVVQDLVKNIPHAILVVYTDHGPMVLDNQSELVKKSENVFRYKPYYSINRHAWWYHKAPEQVTTVIAAAN